MSGGSVTGTEQILLDALKKVENLVSPIAASHVDYKIRLIVQEGIKKFEEEKERINNVPPYS